MNMSELYAAVKILNASGIQMEEVIVRDRRASKIAFNLHPNDIAAFMAIAGKHGWQCHTSMNPSGVHDSNVTRWQVNLAP